MKATKCSHQRSTTRSPFALPGDAQPPKEAMPHVGTKLGEPTVEDVIATAAELFGLGPSRFIAYDLTLPIRRYRMAAMAACRLVTTASYPTIARAFERDHTSVVNACKRARSDAELAGWAELIAAETRRRHEEV